MRLSFDHPLFLVGFRPLFSLAMLSGIVLPILWALFFSGLLNLPEGLNPLIWHAHEMFYGFGWAVLGGFLLTASKNWVKIRGLHGAPLFILAFFWILERYLMLNPEFLKEIPWIRFLLLNFYMFGVSSYVFWSLWIYRKNDTFSDNFFFLLLLTIFFVAKNQLISSTSFATGVSMTTGLFRLAFAVMFERTITQFMKTTEKVSLPRIKILDYSIKFLVFFSIFESFLVKQISGTLLVLTGALLLFRWFLWSPHLGFKKFGNAIMYIGYLGLVFNLLLEGSSRFGYTLGTSSTALHTFTFLTMGVVISGMLVRICQGHTGRPPQFLSADKFAISLMILGAFSRLVFTLIYPQHYIVWIGLAGALWSMCFCILSFRLMPLLFKPRVDGKIH